MLTSFGSQHCMTACTRIQWCMEEGWKYFCIFILVYNTTSWTNLMQCLKKTKNKTKINWLYSVQIFILSVQTTKSPPFPLSGKVGQISKRTWVICWPSYIIISVCPMPIHSPIPVLYWAAMEARLTNSAQNRRGTARSSESERITSRWTKWRPKVWTTAASTCQETQTNVSATTPTCGPNDGLMYEQPPSPPGRRQI